MKIEDQKQVLAQAEEVTKEALQAMLKATQEYKAIEKHKANFEKAEKIKIAKAQEDEADDISQAKYFAKLKERGGQ